MGKPRQRVLRLAYGMSGLLHLAALAVGLTWFQPEAWAVTPADAPPPVRMRVGAFVNNIPKISLSDNEVLLDAYIWFRWDPATWPPAAATSDAGDAETRGAQAAPSADGLSGGAATFEVVQCSGAERTAVYNRPQDGYCCVQWKGARSNFWDVTNYPFDREDVRLVIEDASFDARQLVYEADTEGSGVGPELQVPGCRVHAVNAKVESFTYPTDFGDPDLKDADRSSYSRFVLSITLERDGWAIFFKLFTALLVSTVVALLAFFINPTQVDPRFGLCVGGLFGIVASGYAVSSMLPDTSEPCYADQLHQAGLVVVLAAVAESALSLALHLNHGERGAAIGRRLDRVSFLVLGTGFAATVVWLTVRAIRLG